MLLLVTVLGQPIGEPSELILRDIIQNGHHDVVLDTLVKTVEKTITVDSTKKWMTAEVMVVDNPDSDYPGVVLRRGVHMTRSLLDIPCTVEGSADVALSELLATYVQLIAVPSWNSLPLQQRAFYVIEHYKHAAEALPGMSMGTLHGHIVNVLNDQGESLLNDSGVDAQVASTIADEIIESLRRDSCGEQQEKPTAAAAARPAVKAAHLPLSDFEIQYKDHGIIKGCSLRKRGDQMLLFCGEGDNNAAALAAAIDKLDAYNKAAWEALQEKEAT